MTDETVLTIAVVISAILGLMIGSFVNVVIYRVPRGLSVVRPASRCPTCGNPVSPRDNIPVISWLLLRGRCRSCREPIAVIYPLVELTTGLLFAAATLFFLPTLYQPGDSLEFLGQISILISLWWFAGASVALTMIDLQTHRLPNAIVYPTIIIAAVSAGIAAIAMNDVELFARAMAAGGLLFGFYFALALMWKGGMGLGDVKLAAAIGIYLGIFGWGQLVVGAFAAFVLGGIASVFLIARGAAGRKTGIPFGPWMLSGAWVGLFFGEWIAITYLRFVGVN